MAHIESLLAIVTALLTMAWFVCRFVLARSTSRDLLWRVALVVVVLTPALVLFRNMAITQQWSLPIVPPVEIDLLNSKTRNFRSQAALEELRPTNWTLASAKPDTPSDTHRRPTVRDAAELNPVPINKPITAPSRFAGRIGASALKPPHEGERPWWFALVACLWLAGFLIQCVRSGRAAWNANRLLRFARAVTDPTAAELNAWAATRGGLARSPALMASSLVSGPVVLGWIHPKIVVPDFLVGIDARMQLRAALLHECGHVRRHDLVYEMLLKLVMAVLWPHPLVHKMALELRRLREEICDNYVLKEESPVAYADTLLQLAVRVRLSAGAVIGLGIFARLNRFEERVNALLAPDRLIETRAPRSACWLVLGMTGAVLLSSVVLRFERAAAAPPIAARPVGSPDRSSTAIPLQFAGSETQKADIRAQLADLPTPEAIQAAYRENFARLMPLALSYRVANSQRIGSVERDRVELRSQEWVSKAKPKDISLEPPPVVPNMAATLIKGATLAYVVNNAPERIAELKASPVGT